MLGETKNQFSLTRAASSTSGRAKKQIPIKPAQIGRTNRGQMTAPSQLFHCYPERASAIFREWRLWFSASTDLNDPFEGMPSLSGVVNGIVEEELRKEFAFQPPTAPPWPEYRTMMKPQESHVTIELLYAMQEKFRAMSAGSFRFFCFIGIQPDIAMWGHYANCHRGFAVQFHPEHALFRDLKQVEYQKSRPKPMEPGDSRYLQVKDDSWRGESEYRLIKRVGELEEGERLSDNKPFRFIPLPPEAVKAVYFGWQMPPETRDQMVSDLGARPIPKLVMLPHTSEYALEAFQIEKVTPLAADIRQALRLWVGNQDLGYQAGVTIDTKSPARLCMHKRKRVRAKRV